MRTQKNTLPGNTVYLPYCFVLVIACIAVYLLYDNQFNRRIEGTVSIPLPFQSVGERGHIFFTDKEEANHLVASTHFGYRLVISPLEIGDAEETYEHLNEEIDIDRDDFLSRVEKRANDDEYEIIKKDLPESIQKKIQKRVTAYNLTGVHTEPFKKREYVHDTLGAHVIGFVSVDANDVTRGQYGIESQFDALLSVSNRVVEGTGTTLLKQLNEIRRDTEGGSGDVFLTVDINAQRELEEQLKNIQEKWNTKKVGGIIMDPHSGAVISMASMPTFNPNKYSEVSDFSLFNNPNVQDIYEMGSVFKPLTVAIGLDSGKVSPDDSYTDRGSLVISGRKISNYDGRGRGRNTPIQTILSQSLNTGAVFILQKTTVPVYREYMHRFRFGDVTGIDLPKEVVGQVDNLETNRMIEFATASYGHGIAISPIAAIRAFASLANGGFIVEPYVVKDVQQPVTGGIITGTFSSEESKQLRERRRVFREKSTDQVTEYLIRAYDYAMLGGTLRNPRYSIAAKTGTAQLLDQETGKYAKGKYLHSFFGYFPARDPKYIIFLFAVDPAAQFASETLAKPFSDLTNFFISYYAIPPDR